MVLSSFFINICQTKSHKLDKCKISKISILLTWLSGFIVGPKNLCENAKNEDLTALVFLTSNAGVGFVISYVGITLWGSLSYGAFLYFSQIIFSFMIYVFSKNKNKKICLNCKKEPHLTTFTKSVQNGVKTMLDICGFTVFFSIIKSLLLKKFENGFFTMLVASSLEISSGAFASISAENTVLCAFFTGFTTGFGGVCMCMQTFSVCKDACINKTKFMCKKLLHGLLCGAVSMLFVACTGIEPLKQTYNNLDSNFGIYDLIIGAFFVFLSLNTLKKSLKNKLYST